MTELQDQATTTVDARGLLCPMPIVRIAKAMKTLAPGQVLRLLATDQGSVADVPAWARTTGNDLLEWQEDDGGFVFLLRKS